MVRLKSPVGPVRPAGNAGLGALDDVARSRVASAAAAALAGNTRATYASQWNRFESWCEERGVDPLDADPAQVAAYLAERAETRKLSTVQASAAAIAAAARAGGRADPTKTPLVSDTLRGIARQHAAAPEAAPRQTAALDYATALDLMRAAGLPQRRGRGQETPAAAAARGRRDAAIVALAFCAGLRRSEIASLVWDDITPTARAGQLRVRVRASKANASGRREDLRLLAGPFARAVDALRTAEEPAAADRVVPLSPHQVNRRVQILAAALGLEGVSSHSGRRGLASELVRRGASTTAVQLAGGWRSAAMVARYASAVAVEDGAVAKLFGNGGAADLVAGRLQDDRLVTLFEPVGTEPAAPPPLSAGGGPRPLPRRRGANHASDSRLPPPAGARRGRAGRAQRRGRYRAAVRGGGQFKHSYPCLGG